MLLMFYTVLYLLVSQINSFNIKREARAEYNELISNHNETVTTLKTITQDQNNYLNVIKNSRKAQNLKSNVFDRMLSNEMLSIKHHLYEKDVLSSSVYLSFKNNVPTPTLEINQKWPIDKLISVTSVKPRFEVSSSDTPVYFPLSSKKESSGAPQMNQIVYSDGDLNMEIETKNKIIEVRSFTVMPIHTSESLQHIQQTKSQCTCFKYNHHTICSHRGIGDQMNTEKICTHTEHYLTNSPKCTRTEACSVSLTYFPYFVYPSFFLGITTEAFKTYYNPDIINNLKLPKHKKHKKIKIPYVDDAFYSDSDESKEVDDGDDENKYDYSESDKSDDDVIINKCPKNKCKTKLYNINYESGRADPDFEKKIQSGRIKVIDKDKFAEDVIDDLKVYYNDAVIKDCYCSLSSFKYKSKDMFMYIITILFLLWN